MPYFIVTYDIASPKRLPKMLKLLRRYLVWVQKSVFEGELTGKGYLRLRREVKAIVDKNNDSVIFYKIRTEKVIKREILGKDKEDEIYYI